DGDGAAGPRHAQAFRHAVDGDDLLGPEQQGAADRELADRTRAPYGDRVGRLDVALHRRLPAGSEDVAEEQRPLVREAVRHLDGADVGVRYAHVLGLAARIAAGQVGVAEETCGAVAVQLVGDALVTVGALAYREMSP